MVRKLKPLRRLVLSFLVILSFGAPAQELSNLSAVQRGDNVEVTYQLRGQLGKAYHVVLYASHDNYAAPLKLVEGDTGDKRVIPGPSKLIVWKIKDELTNYYGDIAFEIRAVPAPALFTEVTTSAPKVKRGSEVTVAWKGGQPNQNVTVDLMKGDQIVHAGSASQSNIKYTVPAKMKTGKYQIRLSQGGEVFSGSTLTVTGKIPLVAKIAVVPVIGVIVYVLWPKEGEFPEPPDLTGD